MAKTSKPARSRKAPTANAAGVPSSPQPPSIADTTVLSEKLVLETCKPPSKQAHLAALLIRDEGATLDQMVAATGWLPHTTRAALTGLKKKGYALSSDKLDGVRTYRAAAPK